ncbi:MAG: hypothetical protein ACRD0K_19605 [Egibacteraceae bacterium]
MAQRADVAFTVEARTALYRQLLDRARRLMAHSESVVIDDSWNEQGWRDAAATRRASRPQPVWRCAARRRWGDLRVTGLSQRAKRGGDASDATAEALDRPAKAAVPWPEAVRLDTPASRT